MPDSKPGQIFWNELMTTDPAAAGKFYAAVVGWQTDTMPMPGGPEGAVYHIWKAGEDAAGGMMQMAGPQFDGVPPHWVAYVHVADVDSAAGKVETAGGKLIAAPFDVDGIGRICIIADPTGGTIGLITPADSGGG